MDILILGGSRFIGRHTVEAALQGGHRVTVLNRGQSPDDLPPEVERLRGDLDQGADGLVALEGRRWDACADISGYTPRQVRASAERLRGQIGRYVYVSSRAAYAEPCPLPITEDHALQRPAAQDITEIDGETYGPLKVACEEVVREVYGPACTIVRPQVVAGPDDQSLRYTYWVERAARGGVMLAPGDGSDHLQVIDVRDVARFLVRVIEQDRPGTFNLAGARLTWAEFLRLAGAEAVRWTAPAKLGAALSDTELGLYVSDEAPDAGRMYVSAERAIQAGLTITDPAVTIRDTQIWASGKALPYALTPAREAELLART
ncbi:NAD-dependent epimerase [Deinococcus irradiatisoli]|uniref:NAD-dependent epimerase n=1 Tax=Deinococcus irradiatisoli TaxID=2202254 RepID=A0A2Z3J9N6_9DEIO|nr:NAD-dependent epimerase/dehydratase family protein [Deinococcus irradiatisoli]AWN21827.1 NAD-dependent epimerase [Deinococcus irradiatisoli]